MNITVIGVGGVGGYFGGKLCRITEEGSSVHFVARGAHLKAIRERGLLVKTAAEGEWVCRPASVTDDLGSLPVPDIVLVCVKSYDLDAVSRRLASNLRPETIIVPLLNGVDVYPRIRKRLETGIILPACVFVGTHIEKPGVVSQSGGACRILIGPDPRFPCKAPAVLTHLFERAGIDLEWFDDIAPAIWTKFTFIAALGLVTAAFDRTLGEVVTSPGLSARLRSVMEEIAAVAAGEGIALPASLVADSLGKMNDFPPETKTSLQRDVEQAGKPDERDLFGGTIIRLGRALGVPTPATLELCDIIERKKPFPRKAEPST